MSRVHAVSSWVLTYPDGTSQMVYDQRIALDLLTVHGGLMELKTQQRTCILERPDEECDICYMCEREQHVSSPS